MLIDRPQIVEGSAIQNPTVPSGPAFPAQPSQGELFFLTIGQVGLFTYTGTAWETFTRAAEFLTHINDDSRHLTTAQNTLLDGITVNFTDINSIPQLDTRLYAAELTLASHVADEARHLSSTQNTFLDQLDLPNLTASNVNFLVGVTSNVQNQITTVSNNLATQQTQINQIQESSSGGQEQLEEDLSSHVADNTRHLTSSQNTLLDGITVTSADINKLASIADFLQTISLENYLAGSSASKLSIDGSNTMTGTLNMGGQRTINGGYPQDPHDLATKEYVDSYVQGIHWVLSVDAATTEFVPLAGIQTIDGVAGETGKRILVKDQVDQSQNGIWIMDTGSWNRATDFNQSAEVNQAAAFVLGGTSQAKSTWVQTNTVVTVGGDAIAWTSFSGPVVTSAGPGIDLAAGGAVSVIEGAGLAFSGNALVADLHASGGLMTTLDNASVNTGVSAQLALTNVGVAGSYTKVTTDAKGRVTAGSNPTTLADYGITDAVSKAEISNPNTSFVIDGGTY